jgi:hypothetical protein
MNAAAHEKMTKVEALTRSPNAGEAAAAKAMLARLEEKYGRLSRKKPDRTTIEEAVRTHEAAMRAYADARQRAQKQREWDSYCKRKIDELMMGFTVERAADWLIDNGEACVQVGEGWPMASTGTRVCMPHELVTRAIAKGMRK